jgi:hypothetical protein
LSPHRHHCDVGMKGMCIIRPDCSIPAFLD